MTYNATRKVRTKDLKSLAAKTKALNDDVKSLIGTLSSLTTSTKTNLVAAVNAVKTLADTAQNTANTAKTNAATAQSTADTAKTNAATAQSTANTAKTNAATANTNIGTLSSLTTSTKTNLVAAVNAVKTLADTAQSTADTAKTNAATAQSTADTAKTNAATAQSTANTAKTNAATANTNIGTLSSLTTSAKGNLVAAINELESIFNERTSFINDAENSNALFCAGFHNSIFRGKYLGNSVTAAQYSAIANGTFADLFIGDYWDIGGTRYRIAHFDYYFNQPGHTGEGFEDMNGDVLPAGSAPVYRNTFPPHHIVVMPDVLGNMPIATADTRTQLYGTCYYRLNGRREIISTLSSAFGADHLMYWIDNFTTTMRAVNDGSYRSDTRASFVCQAELPSSIQLTGTPAVMQSGIPCMEGGALNENRIGGGQFALCRLVPAFVRGVNSTGAYYIDANLFTRDITHVDADGKIIFGSFNKQSIVNYADPTASRPIRPYFCLKG